MILEKGTKVVPFRKSIGCEFYEDECWEAAKENNQSFLYIINKVSECNLCKSERNENRRNNEEVYELSDRKDDMGGNYYLITDFVLYDDKRTLTQFVIERREQNV